MTTKFYYFTYFVNPINQLPLFSENRSKRDIILAFLKKDYEYQYRKADLGYVFVDEIDGYLIAKLGRRSKITRSLPPSQKFEEKKEESWPHCLMIINTNEDPNDGQKIAFEYKNSIFRSPQHQLKVFADELNGRLLGNGYVISINSITDQENFWDVARRYEGRIEKLTFTFNAPNLFKLKDTLNTELKDAQRVYSITKATFGLENADGKLTIPQGNEFLKQGVEYVSAGGGEYQLRVRAKGKININSSKNTKTKNFDKLEIDYLGRDKKQLLNILKQIFE